MFIYYYEIVDLPLPEVQDRIESLFDEFDAWAGEAYRSGEEMVGKMRLTAAPGVAREVRLTVWPLHRTDDLATMQLTWEAAGASALFPRLEGDLVAARLAADLTQVSLRGSYTPPLGSVGRALDKAMLHRVAEASVKYFVDRVVAGVITAGDPVPGND